jgi:predicted Ser/Thr protein kinase
MPCFNAGHGQTRSYPDLQDVPQFTWNELSEKDEIGRGSFGSVFTARYKGKVIVVKKLLEEDDRNLKLFYKEARIIN